MFNPNNNKLLKHLKDTNVNNIKFLSLGDVIFGVNKFTYYFYLVPYKFRKVRKTKYTLCRMFMFILREGGTSLFSYNDIITSWFEIVTHYDVIMVEDVGLTAPESSKFAFFCCYLDDVYNEDPYLLDRSISFLHRDRWWCTVVFAEKLILDETVIPMGIPTMFEQIKNKS